eukprot:9859596-Prorocentrum_lima.AAC.1
MTSSLVGSEMCIRDREIKMRGGVVLSSGSWYGLSCGTALMQIMVVIACMSSVGVGLPSPVLRR